MNKNIILKLKRIGITLKNIRESKNISIKELSENTGIKEKYLKKIEAGAAVRFSLSHLERIIKVLDTEIEEVIRGV